VTGGPFDYHRDPVLINAYNQADVEPDKVIRQEKMTTLFRRMAEQAYSVPLVTDSVFYVMSKDLDFTPPTDEQPFFYLMRWRKQS
jgi:peptide/nickel transport system substrate-binding protein